MKNERRKNRFNPEKIFRDDETLQIQEAACRTEKQTPHCAFNQCVSRELVQGQSLLKTEPNTVRSGRFKEVKKETSAEQQIVSFCIQQQDLLSASQMGM